MKTYIPLLVLSAALPSLASAVTIMDEHFAGLRTTYTAGSSTEWYSGSGTSTVTYTQATNGSLSLATGASGRHVVGYFTAASGVNGPVTLGVGESMTVTVNFTLDGTTLGNASNNLRMGLFDSTGRVSADNHGNSNAAFEGYNGYILTTNAGASGSVLAIRERTNTSSTALISTASDYTALGTNESVTTSLATATAYTATFVLTRSAEALGIVASITGSGLTDYTITRSDTSPVTTFDAFAMSMTSNAADGFTLTGFNVTFTPVPEPSSAAALAGLGILGFAAVRRRRRA